MATAVKGDLARVCSQKEERKRKRLEGFFSSSFFFSVIQANMLTSKMSGTDETHVRVRGSGCPSACVLRSLQTATSISTLPSLSPSPVLQQLLYSVSSVYMRASEQEENQMHFYLAYLSCRGGTRGASVHATGLPSE